VRMRGNGAVELGAVEGRDRAAQPPVTNSGERVRDVTYVTGRSLHPSFTLSTYVGADPAFALQ
jgi:hypothetical protein